MLICVCLAILGISKFREKFVYQKPTAPAGIGGVLDDGLRLWRLSLPLTWGLALLAQATKTAPAFLFPPVQVAALPRNVELMQRFVSAMGAASRYQLVGFLFGVIAYGFTNAILLRVNSVCMNSPLSFGAAVSRGFKLVLRTLGFFILLGAYIGIPVALVLVPFAVMAGGASPVSQVIMAVLVFFLCLLVIYVAIKLVIGYPAMIVDDLGITKAMSTSWNLTKGFWWRVALLVSVLGIIVLVLEALLGLVAGGAVGLVGAQRDLVVRVTQLANVVLFSFLGSLSPAVLLAIYDDLKLRRQGGDLADRVSALAAQ
jgi:glycerophosphoryl diester phosphodiesterase family protein